MRARIVESGGFFAPFDELGAAVDAAVAIQRTLQSEVFAPDVRIGAHAGSAFKTATSFTDDSGQSVRDAARIGAAVTAGEVLVSWETLESMKVTFHPSPA